MISINELYSTHHDAYIAIANDRNFDAQSSFLSSAGLSRSLNGQLRSLELFAGQGNHSKVLREKLGYSAYCVDSSAVMRDWAVKQRVVDEKQYIVATLPDDLLIHFGQTKFHLVFGLRYSIGYIKSSQLKNLYNSLSCLLEKEGRIIFELHTAENIRNNFKDLDIRERTALGADGTIYRCEWPSGPVERMAKSRLVAMNVRIKKTDLNGAVTEFAFRSEEYMHELDDISSAALTSSLDTNVIYNELNFPGSVLVCHTKKEYLANAY